MCRISIGWTLVGRMAGNGVLERLASRGEGRRGLATQNFTMCNWTVLPGSQVAVQRNFSGATVVTLSCPEKLNALTPAMLHCLKATIAQDPSALMLFNGTGKAFCAGGNTSEFLKMGQVPIEETSGHLGFFRNIFEVCHMMGARSGNRVTIAHGVAAGSGMSLSVLVDGPRVVTEDCTYSMPETIIGLSPSAGGSFFLPRIPHSVGIMMGLLGTPLTGREALYLGVATHLIAKDKIPQLLLAAPRHKGAPAELLAPFAATAGDVEGTPDARGGEVLPHLEAIERCFSQPTVGEVAAALGREGGAHAQWAEGAIGELAKRPPLALAVSLESMRRGRGRDLGSCLREELRATRRLLAGPDFFEGVACNFGARKGGTPTWGGGVPSQEEVEGFFAPLPADDDLQLWEP